MTSPLQLPPNAWRNSKNYAADDFPVSTVPGDRIYHNVIGGWWTWLESSPGVGWWTPAPSALLVKVYQTTTATSTNSTQYLPLQNMDGIVKNVNSWWKYSPTSFCRFQPDVPGWYELGGSVAWAVVAGGQWRAAAWLLNGTTQIAHGGNTVATPPTVPCIQLLPPQQVYLNGSTDYIQPIVISSTGTSTLSPPESGQRSTNIWVKYMQFEA